MKLDNSVKSFFFLHFIFKSCRQQILRTYYIHSHHSEKREIEVLFSALKNSPFPLARSTKLHIRALVLIPCLIPCHPAGSEKSARESHNSHHLITQRDIAFARTHDMCVDPSRYMSTTGPAMGTVAQFVPKIEKLSHMIKCASDQRPWLWLLSKVIFRLPNTSSMSAFSAAQV